MADSVPIAYTAYDGSKVGNDALRLSIQKKQIGGVDDIARLAAPKTAQVLYNAMRVGPRLILRSAFELLRANMVTRVISVVVLLAIDKFSLFKGRISFKQFLINVTLALMLLVGGTAGWVLGGRVISLVVESLVLGILAGVIGAGVLSAGLGWLVNRVIHLFVQDDTEDMLDIYSQVFFNLAEKHRLNPQEIDVVVENIGMSRQLVRDIFVEEERFNFARGVIEPIVLEVAGRRQGGC